MKPARELLKSGRVSEAKYEPPLLSGYVLEGAKNYRSGLRIKSAIDVESQVLQLFEADAIETSHSPNRPISKKY
ncbi:MAG: hypothetical protein ACREFF_04220 [Candidatus Udaeobacter sp.]